MILDGYKMIGGVHPETASIKNVLAFHGVHAPHTGKPFSEAMLLGIGGGLGSCYIMWEWEKRVPNVVLAFRNKSNYAVEYLQTLCIRLGASTEVFETGGKKKAAAQLEQLIMNGTPAIVWIDLGAVPYYMHFLQVGVVVVYGFGNDGFTVDKLAKKPYIIDSDKMATVRARIPSFKNRIMTVEPKTPIHLEVAIGEGLQDHINYLSASSTSFALLAIKKWSRLMTDTKNSKGWPNVFRNTKGLYGVLRTIYEAIEHIGTGGGGLRGMYADFLDEAATTLGNDDLKPVASLYRALHQRWSTLAQAVLPDHIESFKISKEMLNRRAALRLEKGGFSLDDVGQLNDDIHYLKAEVNTIFPMSKVATSQLFAEIQSQLSNIYEHEKEALVALQRAIDK